MKDREISKKGKVSELKEKEVRKIKKEIKESYKIGIEYYEDIEKQNN